MPNPARAPLQIRPNGLLGFLELKRADAPIQLEANLQPVVDLSKWYLDTNSEFLALTPKTFNAVGTLNFPEWSVPESEWWYVVDMSVLVFDGAAEAAKFQLQVFDAGTLLNATSSLFSEILTIGASEQVGLTLSGFFMRPRTTPALLVSTVTGVIDVQGCIKFCRLPI